MIYIAICPQRNQNPFQAGNPQYQKPTQYLRAPPSLNASSSYQVTAHPPGSLSSKYPACQMISNATDADMDQLEQHLVPTTKAGSCALACMQKETGTVSTSHIILKLRLIIILNLHFLTRFKTANSIQINSSTEHSV